MTSEYADVRDMFRELAGLSERSSAYERQRERIVQRCLPLADHIARRFDGRGEPREDLIQVARVGLVQRGQPIRCRDRIGLRVLRGADDHG